MAKKDNFQTILEYKHNISLANKVAKLLLREEKLYSKIYKALKKSIIAWTENADGIVVTEGRGKDKGKEITVTLPMVHSEHDRAFRRYMDVLRLVMPYAHATMKAVEVKTDTTGSIAFQISIPNLKEEKKKVKNIK